MYEVDVEGGGEGLYCRLKLFFIIIVLVGFLGGVIISE